MESGARRLLIIYRTSLPTSLKADLVAQLGSMQVYSARRVLMNILGAYEPPDAPRSIRLSYRSGVSQNLTQLMYNLVCFQTTIPRIEVTNSPAHIALPANVRRSTK